jgi:hypothetical protein
LGSLRWLAVIKQQPEMLSQADGAQPRLQARALSLAHGRNCLRGVVAVCERTRIDAARALRRRRPFAPMPEDISRTHTRTLIASIDVVI